ncbi:MAG: 50S ribosomal protein L19e [Candidatus Aenigmatarchaeota archaeon]
MSLQKKLAARILKVGKSRIWLDPEKKKEIEEAITRADVKKLIQKGYIKVLSEKIKREEGKRRKKGIGSRKGKKYSKFSKKERWVSTVRALRNFLKELKKKNMITQETFKKTYRLVKGGMFRSKSHLKVYLEQRGLIKKR